MIPYQLFVVLCRIATYRALVEGEHRQELRSYLAVAIMNRGAALWDLGKLEEALAACDDSA